MALYTRVISIVKFRPLRVAVVYGYFMRTNLKISERMV